MVLGPRRLRLQHPISHQAAEPGPQGCCGHDAEHCDRQDDFARGGGHPGGLHRHQRNGADRRLHRGLGDVGHGHEQSLAGAEFASLQAEQRANAAGHQPDRQHRQPSQAATPGHPEIHLSAHQSEQHQLGEHPD